MTLSSLTLLTALCVAVTSVSPASADESRNWGPSHDAVSGYRTYSESTVRVYRDDKVISSTDTGAGSHYSHITVYVRAFSQTFVLRLIKNRYLFPSSYVERLMTTAGPEYIQTNNMYADHCFYIGSVDGYPASTASACTCHGFRGEFTVDSETYNVEPVDESLSGRHRVYRESDSIQPIRVCGNTGEMIPDRSSLMTTIRKKRDLRWPQDLEGKTRVVEFYVVNDFAQFEAMGNDTAKTIDRTKTIVNAASAMYHPESIYIALVGVEVWTNADMIDVNATDKKATLDQFCRYRQTNINPSHNNDNAQLFTGISFSGGVIGAASYSTMCDYEASCAFTHDGSSMAGRTAAVVAHEMGHNFGFEHDDEITGRSCPCDDPTRTCIMESIIYEPAATRWSQCSKDQLQESFDKDLDYCLHNIPPTIHGDTPDCGNGIVEQGEECDCGNAPASQCNRACCVNCRITATASCAYGRCCDVAACQLKPATTECRASKGQCDLAEYCDGIDPLCPSDVYRRNTDSCTVNGVLAYCYNGECRSHQSQCRLWWGNDAHNAANECYTTYNIGGYTGGNCGYNITSNIYFPCPSTDVLCGSLHCDVVVVYPLGPVRSDRVNFQTRTGQTIVRYITGNVRCVVNYYPTFYNGPDRPDPGLVPDGAACGTEMMCLNQQCVKLSSIDTAECDDCSARGVCNTLGQCHCDIGFSPPNCSQPGGGGSYHSNAASPYPIPIPPGTTGPYFTDQTPLLLGVVIGSVAAVVVMAIVIGVIVWRAAATSAVKPSVSASPVAVSSRPHVHPRFSPSQSYLRGYAGCYNNGYYGNGRFEPNRYPYCYQSRTNVQWDHCPHHCH